MRRLIETLKTRHSADFFEVMRFGVTGIVMNILLYLVYLGLTHAGLGPKTAATLVYILGTFTNFVAQKFLTFRNKAPAGPQFPRFAALFLLGYLVVIAGQYVLVDILHYPHEWVQAGLIIAVPVMSYVLQKIWVFRQP